MTLYISKILRRMLLSFAAVFILLTATLCMLSIFVAPSYAAGSISDGEGNSYPSISTAIATVTDGGTIDLTIAGDISETVSVSRAITVNIEGGTITGNITASGGSELNISNITVNGGLTYSGNSTKGKIVDCTITRTSGVGVSVGAGSEVYEITDTDITTSSYGIRMNAVSGSSIKVGKISGCNITTTSIGSTSDKSTAPIFMDGGWGIENSSLIIDSIEDCKLVCNGRYLEDAGIQILRTTHVDSQQLRIGNVTGCDIKCNNGASGMFIHEAEVGNIKNTDIHCNISEVGQARHANGIYSFRSKIDLIENVDVLVEGTSGSGIYSQSAGPPSGIGEIKGTTVEAYSYGLNNAGQVGNISDSSFKCHNTGTGATSSAQFAAIRMSSGSIGDMTNVTLESEAFGIYTNSGVTIGDITDSEITAGYKGIYAYGSRPNYPTVIGDITDTTITAKANNAIHNQGASIGTISESTIETQQASGTGGIAIYNYGYADIASIEDSLVKGYAGVYGYGTSSAGPNTVGSITGSTLETTGVGVQLNGASIETMEDNEISGQNCIVLMDYTSATVNNHAMIKTISGGKLTATNTGISARTNSTIEEVDGVSITAGGTGIVAQSGGEITKVSDCDIDAESYGIDVKDTSKIGTLSGNVVKATGEDAYEAVIVRSGGELTEIISGTYTGKNSGVNNQGELTTVSGGTFVGESRNGMQIVGNGVTETISGGVFKGTTNGLNNEGTLKVITGAPVFYGETGHAVRNSTEDDKIEVEPGLTTELKGNARYYGGQGEFEDDSLDIYPTFTPKNIPYTMSTRTVAVDGFSEVSFHYLTVKCEVSYDGNGGTGDMDDDGYEGDWVNDLKAAENKFVRDSYVFTGWNTKANGSGTSYQPGETINITEEEMTLYAQWKDNTPPEPAPTPEPTPTPDPTPIPFEYTITYDLNGGEYNGSADDITEDYEAGTKIKIHAAPTREGYTFLYWKGSEYMPGDPYTVTKDHTFTAQWKKLPEDSEKSKKDDKTPVTGDDNTHMPWLALLIASSLAAVALVSIRIIRKGRVQD